MNRFSGRRHLGSARKTVRNEGMTPGFVQGCIILVGALQSSRDQVLERAVQRRVQGCVCGGVICSGVPRTRRCSDVPRKGRPDISILILKIYPKPRPVAQAHGKVEMGAERPISTPHLGVYSPPKHAPSITPTIPSGTIPDNPHNVSQIMRARGASQLRCWCGRTLQRVQTPLSRAVRPHT